MLFLVWENTAVQIMLWNAHSLVLFLLQLCAAGRSQTRPVLCCLLIGPRPTTRGRTASGAFTWKRTRGSCLTSKCKRLHPGVGAGRTQIDLEVWPGVNMRGLTLLHITRTWESTVLLIGLSLFYFPDIKNSVLLPARSLTRLASKPPCSHFPGVSLGVGFEMNTALARELLSATYSGLTNYNSIHIQRTCKCHSARVCTHSPLQPSIFGERPIHHTQAHTRSQLLTKQLGASTEQCRSLGKWLRTSFSWLKSPFMFIQIQMKIFLLRVTDSHTFISMSTQSIQRTKYYSRSNLF